MLIFRFVDAVGWAVDSWQFDQGDADKKLCRFPKGYLIMRRKEDEDILSLIYVLEMKDTWPGPVRRTHVATSTSRTLRRQEAEPLQIPSGFV